MANKMNRKTAKMNSSVILRNPTRVISSINTSTHTNGSKNSSMVGTKSPYINSESPVKQRRLLSDYAEVRPLKFRCTSFLQMFSSECRPTLMPAQISELYQAKCQDLRLQYFANQESRFHDFCNKYCVDGKIILRELGIAKHTAKVLKGIIKANKNVAHLDIRKNPIGDLGISEITGAIRGSTSLVHVDFSSNELGPKGGSFLFKSLLGNHSVTSVDVSSHEGLHRNRLGEKGLERLVPVLQLNKILSILNLAGNGIKSEGLRYIAEGISRNTTLTSLKISQNEIQGTAPTVQYLKKIILESKLIELDVSDNPLGNSCMEALGQLLSNSGMSLKRLYFSNVDITSVCTPTLFSNLKSNGILRVLRMDRNSLGGAELKFALQELVGTYSSIETLSIAECGLGDEAGSALFKALGHGSRALKTILMSKNGLDILTAKALGELLKNPSVSLRVLDLSSNKIDDSGALEISEGLKQNASLSILNLSSNSLYTDAGKELLEAIKVNNYMEKLILRYNSINNKYITEIEQKTDSNMLNARRKKVPVYKQEIKAIVVNEELVDELEWKAEQYKQQRKAVETEIEKDMKAFDILKEKELEKYEIVRKVFERAIDEERGVDTKIEELKEVEEGVRKGSEKKMHQLNQKIQSVRNKISQVETDVSEARKEVEQKQEEHAIAQEKLRKELHACKTKLYILRTHSKNYSSVAKIAWDNKKKLWESLQFQSALKFEDTINMESPNNAKAETIKEASPKQPESKNENESEVTVKTANEGNKKLPEEFEVKDYNASPKLAFKKKEKKTQYTQKEKAKPIISLKKVPEPATEETKEPPAIKEEKKTAPPTVSIPVQPDMNEQQDLSSLNLIKVSSTAKKKASPKKSPKRVTVIKKTLS